MSDRDGRRRAFRGIWASLVSVACLLRGLPMLCCAAPRTPLRVLCIVALDTVHVLRTARWMPRQRRTELALFLDFQACTNAMWDRKGLCEREYRAVREQLEECGLGLWIAEYLRRLRELEAQRPLIGGGRQRFDEVRTYREAVARLALATIAAIALEFECLDDAICSTRCDGDVATLFRMAMQCQIIDDVLDYRADLSAQLPSFLTAATSLPLGMTWTAEAAWSYAAAPARSGAFPLEAALSILTALTRLVVAVGGRAAVRTASAAHRGRA